MESYRSLLEIITDVGDSGLLAALVVLGSLYLAITGERRTALIFLGSLFLAAMGIALLKFIFIGCNVHATLGIYSPSGHAAMTAAVLGTMSVIVASALTKRYRLVPLVFVIPMILAVAFSRVALGYHSVKEVIMGLALGGAVAALAYGVMSRRNTQSIKPVRFVLFLLFTGLIFYGAHLSAEDTIQRLASVLHVDDSLCAILKDV